MWSFTIQIYSNYDNGVAGQTSLTLKNVDGNEPEHLVMFHIIDGGC